MGMLQTVHFYSQINSLDKTVSINYVAKRRTGLWVTGVINLNYCFTIINESNTF